MSLTLDLVRHGEAAPAGAGGDSQRPLSARGMKVITELARGLASEGWAPDRILASPLLRAQQTARLLAEHGTHGKLVGTLAALRPDGVPREVITELAAQGATAGHIVLVGHMPLLALLAATLGRDEPSFAPGQLWRITLPNGPAAHAGTLAFTRRVDG